MTPEELLEAAVLIYLRGLGLPDDPTAPGKRLKNSGRDHSEPARRPHLRARRPA